MKIEKENTNMKATTVNGKYHIRAINGYTIKYDREYFTITEVIECPVCHKRYIEHPTFNNMVDGTCDGGLRWEIVQYNQCCTDECRAQILREHPFIFC